MRTVTHIYTHTHSKMCYIVRTSVTYRGISIAVIVGFACDISAPRVCVCVRSRAKRNGPRGVDVDPTRRRAKRSAARARAPVKTARESSSSRPTRRRRGRGARRTDGRTRRESNPQSRAVEGQRGNWDDAKGTCEGRRLRRDCVDNRRRNSSGNFWGYRGTPGRAGGAGRR